MLQMSSRQMREPWQCLSVCFIAGELAEAGQYGLEALAHVLGHGDVGLGAWGLHTPWGELLDMGIDQDEFPYELRVLIHALKVLAAGEPPAMEAGMSRHVWTIKELLALIEEC
jgi:hypothetical protein